MAAYVQGCVGVRLCAFVCVCAAAYSCAFVWGFICVRVCVSVLMCHPDLRRHFELCTAIGKVSTHLVLRVSRPEPRDISDHSLDDKV